MAQTKKPLDIVVVGGSLGGLFTGIVLKRLGHKISILERNPTPLLQHQGAGVVAGGDTQAFFDKYDITRRPIAVTSRLRHYLDKDGAVIDEEDSVQKMTSWDLLYYLLRANFDRVESEYVETPLPKAPIGEGEASYQYGHMVTSIKEAGSKLEVTFEDTTNDHQPNGTLTADLLIAADGPSSTIRSLVAPSAPTRTCAGYVAFRGTVAEHLTSPSAASAFIEKFCFYHAPATQILAYTIPGPNGTLTRGHRLINWVWYCNYAASSPEYVDLMTDADGTHHHYTLPIDKMRPRIWDAQKSHARATLPPQFAELVSKTEHPFVQAITDVEPPERNCFLGGKVRLVGDALSGFRPHTAASTSQAAFDALGLGEVMERVDGMVEGENPEWGWWESHTLEYARQVQAHGVRLGERSQFGSHPLAR